MQLGVALAPERVPRLLASRDEPPSTAGGTARRPRPASRTGTRARSGRRLTGCSTTGRGCGSPSSVSSIDARAAGQRRLTWSLAPSGRVPAGGRRRATPPCRDVDEPDRVEPRASRLGRLRRAQPELGRDRPQRLDHVARCARRARGRAARRPRRPRRGARRPRTTAASASSSPTSARASSMPVGPHEPARVDEPGELVAREERLLERRVARHRQVLGVRQHAPRSRPPGSPPRAGSARRPADACRASGGSRSRSRAAARSTRHSSSSSPKLPRVPRAPRPRPRARGAAAPRSSCSASASPRPARGSGSTAASVSAVARRPGAPR